jgi:hypothetical protein
MGEDKGTRAPGHKGTRAQGHKGTRAQGHKGIRATTRLAPLSVLFPSDSHHITYILSNVHRT